MHRIILSSMLAAALLLAAAGGARAQGSVMLMGGGGEDVTEGGPFDWFVQQADSGRIINIDTDDIAPSYATDFINLGAAPNSRSMRITAAMANDPAVRDTLLTASGIFIEGGDQSRYIAAWKGTMVEDALRQVFTRGDAIGGTSAGLAVLSGVLFDATNGSAYPEVVLRDPYDATISLTDDFLPDVLPGVLADSHFMERGRLGRLAAMLARRAEDHGEDLLGVGVDSYTAFCIGPGGVGRVYGLSVGIVHASDSTERVCNPGEPLHYTNLVMHQLTNGGRFDLSTRTVLYPGSGVLPVDTPVEAGEYRAVTLDGSRLETYAAGEVRAVGMDGSAENWWEGGLTVSEGLGDVPRAAVVPHVYANSGLIANHLVGGQLAVANNPGFAALYLDQGSSASIDAGGRMTVDSGIAHLLATHRVSHSGRSSDRIPGYVNATLNFLAAGDTLELNPLYETSEGGGSGAGDVQRPELHGAHPNPVRRDAVVRFSLPRAGEVTLTLFNVLGQRVRTLARGGFAAGTHEVPIDGQAFASGVYLARLEAGGEEDIRRVVVIK